MSHVPTLATWNDPKNRLETYQSCLAADRHRGRLAPPPDEGEHTMKTTKVKTIKELFVKDMARVQGGQGSGDTCEPPLKPMPPNTTLACCEEADDGCCVVE